MKEEWKCVFMDDGEVSVMIYGIARRRQSSVDN